MGAGPLDISAVLTTLNVVNVKKGVFKQFDEGTILLDVIEKGDWDSPALAAMLGEKDGEKLRIQAHTGGNPNVNVGVAEGRGYPRAGSQTRDALFFRSQRMIAGMAQTTEAINRAGGEPQSVFKVAAMETEGMMNNIRKRTNQYLFGDGSGIMASCLDSATEAFDDGDETVRVVDASKLENGMEIMFRGKADGSTIGGGVVPTGHDSTTDENGNTVYKPVKITALNKTTNLFTAAYYNNGAYDATTDADFQDIGLFLWDQQGKVTWGLENICGTINPSQSGFNPASLPTDTVGMSAAFGAVDRLASGKDWWQALAALDLAGLPISIKDHIQPTAINLITRDSNLRGSGDVMVLCDGTRWHEMINALEVGKRTFQRTSIVDGKYEVVKYDIFTFAWDPDCTAGTTSGTGKMFFFAPKHLFRLIVTPWQFETRGGGRYTQSIDPFNRPTGSWRANMEHEGQLVCGSVLPCTMFDNVG